MKIITRISYMLVLVFATATILLSCQSGASKEKGDQEKSEFEKARNESVTKLEDLRDDINYRVEDIDRRLEDASSEMKDGLQGAKEALTKERTDLDRALDNVKNATQETWIEVSRFAEESYEKTKQKANKIAKDVEEWFETSESE